MGRESRLHPNEMLIIWPSSFSGNAVALRLLGNPFHADHGFHPHLYPHFGHYQSNISASPREFVVLYSPSPRFGERGPGQRCEGLFVGKIGVLLFGVI